MAIFKSNKGLYYHKKYGRVKYLGQLDLVSDLNNSTDSESFGFTISAKKVPKRNCLMFHPYSVVHLFNRPHRWSKTTCYHMIIPIEITLSKTNQCRCFETCHLQRQLSSRECIALN